MLIFGDSSEPIRQRLSQPDQSQVGKSL